MMVIRTEGNEGQNASLCLTTGAKWVLGLVGGVAATFVTTFTIWLGTNVVELKTNVTVIAERVQYSSAMLQARIEELENAYRKPRT